jgi:hypothetical protein
MQNPSISLKAARIPIPNLHSIAVKVHLGFTTHTGEYSSPVLPMTVFLLHILKLKKAITAWGPEGCRGSRADHDAMMAAAEVVRKDLRQLASYAQYTQVNNTKSWLELGFTLRLPKHKTQRLQKVQNFRRFIARNIPEPGIKLRWEMPLGAKDKNVKAYIIQRSNTPEYPAAHIGIPNILAIVSATFFIDMEPMPGANWYWVTPVNGAGMGVRSEAVFYLAPEEL